MEKTERYRSSIERGWSDLQLGIRWLYRYLSDDKSGPEKILDMAADDFALIITELSSLGRGDAGREAEQLLELFMTERSLSENESQGMPVRFLLLLRDALIGAYDVDDWRYEAQEAASDYLHILRYAAQDIEAVSMYQGKVAERFNDYLQQARDILRPARIQVTLRGMTVKEYDTKDTYFESESALLTGFEKRCREMGLELSHYELETMEKAARSRFGQVGMMDSRFIEWLLTRAIRHQAERLAEYGGSTREITSNDIAAAW